MAAAVVMVVSGVVSAVVVDVSARRVRGPVLRCSLGENDRVTTKHSLCSRRSVSFVRGWRPRIAALRFMRGHGGQGGRVISAGGGVNKTGGGVGGGVGVGGGGGGGGDGGDRRRYLCSSALCGACNSCLFSLPTPPCEVSPGLQAYPHTAPGINLWWKESFPDVIAQETSRTPRPPNCQASRWEKLPLLLYQVLPRTSLSYPRCLWKWLHQKTSQLVRRCHPCARKSASKAALGRMQLTLYGNRPTPHGASCSVQEMSVWSVKTRRAPSRH